MPSSYFVVPASMPCIARFHRACVPKATPPRETTCPTRRQVASDPGRTRLPTEPSWRATYVSPMVSPARVRTTPAPAASPSRGLDFAGSAKCSGGVSRWRMFSTTISAARPTGRASGIRSIRPSAPRASSSAWVVASEAARIVAPTPVMPKRQPACRTSARIVLSLARCPTNGDETEADRYDGDVQQQRGGPLPLLVAPRLGERQRGRERRAAGVEDVLRDDGEQEVRTGREPRDQALVHPAPLGQGAGERGGDRGRGQHQADLLSPTDDLRPDHGASR